MYLQELTLKNFRNYENINIEFDRNTNVFIGENGQGKTNIIESIFFSSFLKSHRTNKNMDLIKFDEKQFLIEIKLYLDNSKKINIKVLLDNTSKKNIFINNIKTLKVSDFIGSIKSIIFSPEDLKLIKESPMIRRKFLDMSISQIDNKYLKFIIDYNKLMSMKNNLLKKEIIDERLLDVYDEQISFCSNFIIRKRFEYIEILQEISRILHEKISDFKEKLSIKYVNFLNVNFKNLHTDIDITGNIFDILKRNRKIDKIRKFSTVGIHRDDFSVFLNDRQMINYSSQGQQRSAVISIKFAIVEIIKKMTNEYPVLLLDDMLSELDKNRRNFILNFIENTQTFITCTELQEKIFNSCKIFNVKNGSIS